MSTQRPDSGSGGPFAARLLGTGAALLALAAGSFALAHLSLGHWALPIALLIAAGKATLVVVVFMGVAKERASIRVVAAVALAMTVLFVAFVAADVFTRGSVSLIAPGDNAR